ncbi:MAG: LysM peptidoglycan-binding domain-containing protein [Anaerolineae bacterium]|nr:LysM peptidoglycan-binding domain-containing protein [Anaerolineae bacterium]
MKRINHVLIAMLFALFAIFSGAAQDSGSDTGEAASEDVLPAAYDAYIVQSGDSLFSIAEAFNTTIADLRQINDIAEGEQIYGGQSILLPAGVSAFVEVYEVQPGDTLFGISKRFNTSVGIIQGFNEIGDSTHIEAGQLLIVPSVNESDLLVHVVVPNESLDSISQRYSTSVSVLKALNGIADEGELVAGASILAPNIDETKFELYEVSAADSLYSISRRFATTEETLISLNALTDSLHLEVGQILLVPRIDENIYAVYVVVPGDSLFNIARRYNTTVAQLRALNGVAGGRDLAVGRSIIVPRVDETLFEAVVVETGDSLYSISRRYDVSLSVLKVLNRLADARDLKVGEAILAPKLEDAALEVLVIRAGDSLTAIAETYGTTVEFLQSLNGIANPSLIQLDDSILVPVPIGSFVRPDFGFGLQAFADQDAVDDLVAQVSELAVDWVKVDVSWAELEAEPGIYDYQALDAMVAAFELIDVKILLNVYEAPGWSRRTYTEKLNSTMREYGGPPEDLADFASFMTNLVTRYAGLVDAYEIWKSPNLLKYWTAPVYYQEPELTDDGDYGIPDEVQLGAGYYIPLLKVAYDAIKSHDARALVISAGLAPVGFSDGYNSIDTGTFLQGMLDQGAAASSDAIGAVFSASAVPPTLKCCDKPPGVDSHYESFLQYLPELLDFYTKVLSINGYSDIPIFVTQMGWGTSEGANTATPSSGFEWLTYTSEDEQALYVSQAYSIVQKMENVSAMILYNLNGCAAGDDEACFFSLIDAAGERRPVYASFRDAPKSKSA